MISEETKSLKIVLNHKIKSRLKSKLNNAGFRQVGDDHMFMFIYLKNKTYMMTARISRYTKAHHKEISYLKLLHLLDKYKLACCQCCNDEMIDEGFVLKHPQNPKCPWSGSYAAKNRWPRVLSTTEDSSEVQKSYNPVLHCTDHKCKYYDLL